MLLVCLARLKYVSDSGRELLVRGPCSVARGLRKLTVEDISENIGICDLVI